MQRIAPEKPGEPELVIYRDQFELEEATGFKNLHGYFDRQQNIIVATADSLPHELGHYRDFKSGKMKKILPTHNALERAEVKMRNEIVAIVFAVGRAGIGAATLPYEVQFVGWLSHTLQTEAAKFGTYANKSWAQFSLAEIQDLAEKLSSGQSDWFTRLERVFASYLQEEQIVLTYSLSQSQRLRLSAQREKERT